MFKKSPGLQTAAVLVLFFIFGWLLFTFRILDVPPGINGDEAAIGYNAALVAKSGIDSNGNFLPLFTAVPGSQDWKQPVTFYSTALAFRIFGTSYFVLRAVSVFFVLLSGSLIFLLIYELVGFRAALWSLLIFSTTPIVMIQSHLALENIAPVPFISFWLWTIVRYSREMKNRYLILAAVTLALSIYSYLGLRLIAPSLIILTVFFIYYLNRKYPRKGIIKIFTFLSAFIPFLLILLVAKGIYPGSFLGLYRSYKIISYQQVILPFISSFDPSFLFIKGDAIPYHSTGRHGMFLLASLPLFLAGIARIIRKNNPTLTFVLASFFLVPILYGLGSDIHRASRLLSMIPAFVVICSMGMMALIEIKDRLWRYGIALVVIVMISLNFTDFLRDYWYEYPKRVKSEFSKPYHQVFERAAFLSKSNNLTPFIQEDFKMQNVIAENFFEQVYFPNGLKMWKGDQALPAKSIIIVSDYFLSKKKDIPQEKIGDSEFGILVNNESK